jgi:hypothetical protein
MPLLASSYDQSKYFKAADITAEKKLRIKNVTVEQIGIGSDKEQKLVVWFTNDLHGLVLNKTNNRTLRGAFGDDTANWVGKVIVLFPTTDEFRGRMVPVLRVRIPPPKQPAGNGGQAVVDDGIPEILRRVPKAKPPEPPVEPDVDPDLDDEINI